MQHGPHDQHLGFLCFDLHAVPSCLSMAHPDVVMSPAVQTIVAAQPQPQYVVAAAAPAPAPVSIAEMHNALKNTLRQPPHEVNSRGVG